MNEDVTGNGSSSLYTYSRNPHCKFICLLLLVVLLCRHYLVYIDIASHFKTVSRFSSISSLTHLPSLASVQHSHKIPIIYNGGKAQNQNDILQTYILKQITSLDPALCYITMGMFAGRLGNNMFEYASLYGIARANNLTAILAGNFRLYSIFPNLWIRPVLSWDSYLSYRVQFLRVRLKYGAVFFPGAHHLTEKFNKHDKTNTPCRNISLKGYLASYKFFAPWTEEIRKQFQFSDETKAQAHKILHRQLKNYNLLDRVKSGTVLVGIHVRRGDMLDKNKTHVTTATPDYLAKAMFHMRKKLSSKVIFVVIGQDMTWNKENINGSDVLFIPPGNEPAVDMCIVSEFCDHVITTVGTYSFWCGYLSRGTVTYFRDMHDDGYKDKNHIFKPEDYWPPEWIGL